MNPIIPLFTVSAAHLTGWAAHGFPALPPESKAGIDWPDEPCTKCGNTGVVTTPTDIRIDCPRNCGPWPIRLVSLAGVLITQTDLLTLLSELVCVDRLVFGVDEGHLCFPHHLPIAGYVEQPGHEIVCTRVYPLQQLPLPLPEIVRV